jgi:predicted transcriptional regulator
MRVLNDSADRAFISAVVPVDLRASLQEAARANDRSVSGEIRHALVQYLTAQPEHQRNERREEG